MPMFWWGHVIWLLTLAGGAFLVSWLFADRLHLPQTPYIAVLAAMTGIFWAGYLSANRMDGIAFVVHQWIGGLVGAVVAGPVLIVVVAQGARHSESRVLAPIAPPSGLRLVGAVLWEGIVYGAAEGLLLSVLPVLMAWQLAAALGWTQSGIGVILAGVIALVASLVVIVVHHLGYREFRGPPVAGAALSCGIVSLAYLLTTNPIAAVGGHIIMHVGAILRGAELPPHQETREQAVASMPRVA